VISGLSSHRGPRRLAAAVALLSLLSGCGGGDEAYPTSLTYPPRQDPLFDKAPTEDATPFYPPAPGRLDASIAQINAKQGRTLDPGKVPAPDRQALANVLGKLFGTPAQPLVATGGESENEAAVTDLKLDKDALAAGSRHYRRHCLHCHGLAGDGRGPTGPWLSPAPRDYRQGLFKFISTKTGLDVRKPGRADLLRTVRKGIDGTSMPSFGLLPEKELEEIVSYVIHLSLRGEVEFDLLKAMLPVGGEAGKAALDESIAEEAQKRLTMFLTRWNKSSAVEEPAPYPYLDEKLVDQARTLERQGDKARADELRARAERVREDSVRRGYRIFTDPQGPGSCINCHVDFGRQSPFRYDDWGTLVRPANLTTGVYRGGRRPVDIYWRVAGGIPPSGMPSVPLPGDQTWDVVHFVQALPYPNMLPKDVRDKIYGTPASPPTHASAK
jgi:mono/diheme cytochrome c family protein